MKKILVFLAGVLSVLSISAPAATLSSNNSSEFELNRVTTEIAAKHRLGRLIVKHQYRMIKCIYNFANAKQGGAIGTITLLTEDNVPCVVPNKAIIQQVLIDVATAGTTSASGTMALTAQTAGDLKAALAAASYTGIVAGVPVGTAASSIKMTADRTVTAAIATGAFTAGKWNVLIEYVISE